MLLIDKLRISYKVSHSSPVKTWMVVMAAERAGGYSSKTRESF